MILNKCNVTALFHRSLTKNGWYPEQMRIFRTSRKRLIILVLLLGLILPVVDAQAQQPGQTGNSAATPKSMPQSKRFVSIDFNDVDIRVFIKFISELVGKNFIIDHRVKGKVTIISPAKISINEAYRVFESVLEVHGYATVKAGRVIKIIPSPDARTKSIETKLRDEAVLPEDKVVTQIIPLSYADPNAIKRLLAPLISKSSVILAYPPTNTLIVTDVSSNIKRLVRILETIDITSIGRELSIIPLQYANAPQLVKLLQSVFKAKLKPQKGKIEKDVNFVADDRTNTLVLLAGKADTVKIKQLIKMLDKETPKGKEKIHVYYLEHALAENLAQVLQALPKKQAGADKTKRAPIVSDKVRIAADKATNSLIIMSEKEDYVVLEEIIKKLDVPRAMVYLEILIMEVNVIKEFNLGVEWAAANHGNLGNEKIIFGGGSGVGGATSGMFTPSTSSAADILTFPTGLALGLLGEGITVGSITFPSIAAFIQAYKKDKDVHILSTPQILTMDNEEAQITVGKNIPFKTTTGTTSAAVTYETFEYKDVGIKLKITPYINKDRMVRLKISQEVTKLESTAEFRPTTLKRTIDTMVTVDDKNTIVIGGLIDDSFSDTKRRVPCLGEIPLVGWLFKTDSGTSDKTNLFVFLTPHIIESPKEAEKIYKEKRTQIDRIKEGQIKLYKGNTK